MSTTFLDGDGVFSCIHLVLASVTNTVLIVSFVGIVRLYTFQFPIRDKNLSDSREGSVQFEKKENIQRRWKILAKSSVLK